MGQDPKNKVFGITRGDKSYDTFLKSTSPVVYDFV